MLVVRTVISTLREKLMSVSTEWIVPNEAKDDQFGWHHGNSPSRPIVDGSFILEA